MALLEVVSSALRNSISSRTLRDTSVTTVTKNNIVIRTLILQDIRGRKKRSTQKHLIRTNYIFTMNSDVEESSPEGSSHRSGFEVSTPSITDDDSDADLATVLTQLIRRFYKSFIQSAIRILNSCRL